MGGAFAIGQMPDLTAIGVTRDGVIDDWNASAQTPLGIWRGIVALHGGRIWAHNTPGAGATPLSTSNLYRTRGLHEASGRAA